MATTLREMLDELPPERRAKVDARTAELIREEMALEQLRKAARKTQVAVAGRLRIKQASVSRLEQRSDMLLSTLRSYVEAVGGELELVARLPDQPPVRLTGIGDITKPERSTVRTTHASHSRAVKASSSRVARSRREKELVLA